jgi:hypothetical protein
MRKIVSPLDGIRSPLNTYGIAAFPASVLLSSEPNGFALDFMSNTYAISNNSGAESLIFNDGFGFAADFTDNSYSVRT